MRESPPPPRMLPPVVAEHDLIVHALDALRHHVVASVARKGMPDWSPHTTLGKLTEEYHEYLDEVKAAAGERQAEELLDIANAAVLGYICNCRQRAVGGLKKDSEQ